jgi:hypothetical protein
MAQSASKCCFGVPLFDEFPKFGSLFFFGGLILIMRFPFRIDLDLELIGLEA